MDKVRSLQALHFPELLAEVNAVQQAYLRILNFISNQRLVRMRNEKAFITNLDPMPYQEPYIAHREASDAFVDKCSLLLK